MKKIPVIFIIDVEPDLHFIDRSKPVPWRGYELAFDYLKQMRPRLEEATGSAVKYSWAFRLDPQISETYGRADWPITHYSEYFQDISAHQDALGIHVHGYRWQPTMNEWVVDHGNEAWMEHCVRSSVDAFNKAVGKPCDFFRFGERWMSDAAMKLLDDLAVPIDLSLEPGFAGEDSFHPDKPFTGSIPDQRGVPHAVYQPSSNLSIWEIPLTTVHLRPRLKFWRRPSLVSLNLYRPASQILRAMRTALAERHRYLSMVVRPDVFLSNDHIRNMDRLFDALCEKSMASRFHFVSPSQALNEVIKDKA